MCTLPLQPIAPKGRAIAFDCVLIRLQNCLERLGVPSCNFAFASNAAFAQRSVPLEHGQSEAAKPSHDLLPIAFANPTRVLGKCYIQSPV